VKRLGDIERRHDMTHERFFGDFFQQRPVVMTDQISHWPALTAWGPGYFRSRYGQTPVWLSRYDPSSERTFLEQNIDHQFREGTMAEYVDSLTSENGRYSIRESVGLLQRNPELLDDLDHFRPFGCTHEPPDDQFMALWFAPKGTITGMHIDVGENVLFHLHGHKHVMLFSPDNTALLYEEDLSQLDAPGLADRVDSDTLQMWRHYVRWSKVNAFSPDVERFPLLGTAAYLEGVIGPGDALYIPCGWWHTVRSLDVTISVSKSVFKDEFLRPVPPVPDGRQAAATWETRS